MKDPINIGEFNTPCKELMYVLYMPIKLSYEPKIIIPKSLGGYIDFIRMCVKHYGNLSDMYMYLTVKHLWVEPGCIGGRPGWHTDGFGTDDINYFWCDSQPTEFCNQEFDLSNDHKLSIIQMEEQAKQENIVQYPPLSVIKGDSSHVHRCPVNIIPGYRTFARVSMSKNKYDMIGNAHNYDLDYDWIMYPRNVNRNNTSAIS
jgi:hypothetical protein